MFSSLTPLRTAFGCDLHTYANIDVMRCDVGLDLVRIVGVWRSIDDSNDESVESAYRSLDVGVHGSAYLGCAVETVLPSEGKVDHCKVEHQLAVVVHRRLLRIFSPLQL